MCGFEPTPKSRGGALAALSPPTHTDSTLPRPPLQGDLIFFSPGNQRSPRATHVRFTPSESHPWDSDKLRDLVVTVHQTGEISRNAEECGHFCEFALDLSRANGVRDKVGNIDFLLTKSVSLEVGNDGIIGRRVSLYSFDGEERAVIAEGIVGFNF